MNKALLFIFLLSVSGSTWGQDITFEPAALLFEHPRASNSGLNYPFLPLDYDSNGVADFIGATFNDQFLYKGTATGTYEQLDIYQGFAQRPLCVIDFDGDGDQDVIMERYLNLYETADSFVFLNPDINFAETIIQVADFNQDGFNDLLTHKGNSFDFDELIIQYNQGDNSFTPEVIYNSYDDYGAVDVGDIDGDGDLDIAVAVELGDVPLVVLYRNDTGGYDEVKIPHQFSNGYATVILNDLDTDGDLDILTLGAERDIYFLENVDNYSSDETTLTVTLNDVLFFNLADMNNDSLIDIVAVTANNAQNFNIYVMMGNGGFDFSPPTQVATFPGAGFIGFPNFNYVGNNLPLYDVDADGVLDIVYTDGFGEPNQVVWLRNSTEITSTAEWPADPSVFVYPNPAYNRLEVHGVNDLGGRDYEIWSLAGRRVATGIFENSGLDISRLPAGVYVLRLAAGRTRIRFVKW